MSAPDPSKRDTLISKSLSYLLRHGALKEKLNIDEQGYVKLNEILNHNRIKSNKATTEDIKKVVKNNAKQRFSIIERDGEEYICANQGHSIEAVGDSNLVLISPDELPSEIYHGTYLKKLPLIIRSGGLSRMTRNHIHFTSSLSNLSGIRKNCNVLIYLNIPKCIDANIKFYKSINNVILTSGDENGFVKHDLFLKIIDLNTNDEISITDYLI